MKRIIVLTNIINTLLYLILHPIKDKDTLDFVIKYHLCDIECLTDKEFEEIVKALLKIVIILQV